MTVAILVLDLYIFKDSVIKTTPLQFGHLLVVMRLD